MISSVRNSRVARVVLPLVLAFSAVTVAAPLPAQAAGCYGAACDNLGPKGNGCMGDDKVVARAQGLVSLRYSAACKAFFAYAPYGPNFWPVEIHLEMAKTVDGTLTVVKRLRATVATGNASEWTNMLGARTSAYKFRAIWYDPMGNTIAYTPWAAGGTR